MKKKVFLYIHSHWDREWYREFEEFRLRLIEVVDDIISKLEKNEIPYFYFDGQTAAVEDYLEIHPEKQENIEKLIKNKKLAIGPFYCSADSFLVSCEFLLRNLSIGINYSKKLGCNDFIGYLSDTFGHSAAIPSILKTAQIDKAILWRGLGSLPSELSWQDIAVTYLIQGYFQDIFSLQIDYDKKSQLLKSFIDKISQRSSDNILLPCGADHLKVADNLKTQVKEINKRLNDYEIIISSPFEYLNTVKNADRKKIKGEFLNPSKNFLLKGVYSSRIYQKQQNAYTQWNLSRICEPLATISHINNYSKNWQNEIDYAYKNTIKNHAHDSIYGCSIDEVHKEVENRFIKTNQITKGINKRIIRDLNEESTQLSFLNLSNYTYNGVVEIETEKKLPTKYKAQLVSKRKGFTDEKLFDPNQIPVTEDITTINKYLIEIKNVKPFSTQNAQINKEIKHNIDYSIIENEHIALQNIKDKIHLIDKKNNKIYKNFIEIINRADIGDSYNFGALKGDKEIKAKLTASEVLKKGTIKSTLRLTYEIEIPYQSYISTKRRCFAAKHTIFMDVSISNLQDYLEVDINWENRSKNHILQVRFNLDNPITKTFSEDTVGIIERDFDPNYNIYKHLDAKRGIELKTNTAPMQRFVWAQGFGLITKGLNEYEIKKNSLNLTILRATDLISEPKNPCRGTPAGPPILCPDLQCLGKNNAKFALTFTKKPSDLYKSAEAFYGCIVPFLGKKKIEQFIKINNKNILVQAIKTNQNNEIIFRLINISNKKQQAKIYYPKGYENIYKTNLCENSDKKITANIDFAPKEIITIKCTK